VHGSLLVFPQIIFVTSITAHIQIHRELHKYMSRARLAAIPDSEIAHRCWRCGREDADTEALELDRHKRLLADGREDDYAETWGLLFDVRTLAPIRAELQAQMRADDIPATLA
jgi:hypothetical protein